MQFVYKVEERYDGYSVHEILRNEFLMSRTLIKRVKLHGTLEINGTHVTVRAAVAKGDTVTAAYGDDAGKLNAEEGIGIIYEDEYLAVIDKPAGMVTHPTHGHLDDSLITKLSSRTLHPVIRLDRETSGLLIIAKNGYIHNALSGGDIDKRYIAGVYGTFDPLSGIIDCPIRRREGSVMIRDVHPEGRECRTLYATLFETNGISLVGYKLITGRCHQIRVHSTYSGHPLIGDGLYGPNSADNPNGSFPGSIELDRLAGRQLLHSSYLSFVHPLTKERLKFTCPLPRDLRRVFSSVPGEVLDKLPAELEGLFLP